MIVVQSGSFKLLNKKCIYPDNSAGKVFLFPMKMTDSRRQAGLKGEGQRGKQTGKGGSDTQREMKGGG